MKAVLLEKIVHGQPVQRKRHAHVAVEFKLRQQGDTTVLPRRNLLGVLVDAAKNVNLHLGTSDETHSKKLKQTENLGSFAVALDVANNLDSDAFLVLTVPTLKHFAKRADPDFIQQFVAVRQIAAQLRNQVALLIASRQRRTAVATSLIIPFFFRF